VSHKPDLWYQLRYGIAFRIIAPFLLLTLLIAAAGAFVITTLMTRTANERYATQLLDAGRVAAQRLINLENSRLESLRLIAATQGVADNLAEGETAVLNTLIRPIILNNRLDVVEIINLEGDEVYGWQRPPGGAADSVQPRSGANFAHIEEVQRVLSGYSDEFGDKRVIITETPDGIVLFTIGPVFLQGEQVGAVLIGSYLDGVVQDLSQNAVARVTLYSQNGDVLATTLGATSPDSPLSLAADPARHALVLASIQESPERYQLVASLADSETPLEAAEVMGQQYQLAYGDWRLRGQSFGLFSVAFPTNYVDSPLVAGRNVLLALLLLAFFAVILVGLLVTSRITKPLSQLVGVATAVGEGQLDQRSGIERRDEIGQLAASFDLMTVRLENRNRALLKQARELETILNSITDGVLLLDSADRIVTTNVAAQKLLADLSHDFLADGTLQEMPLLVRGRHENNGRSVEGTAVVPHFRQHQIGNRMLTSLATDVTDPEGDLYGTVIVMRDVTQQVEAEHLKDAFITSISHELRTPLTAIKAYADLLQKTSAGQLNERQVQFMQNIQKSSQQLEMHINQLLHISEIQAGTVRLARQRIALNDLAAAAAENWQKRFESKRLDLTLTLPYTPAWVLVDPGHMGWAIEALLSNAHNYTAPGGKVTVRLWTEADYVHLAVEDNGIGIAAADQPRLFERFFRAQNSINYEMRGVGLGLFIARSVIELHNGRLEVTSELGQGSAFTITLPIETA
jgi:signal transduction histidine kinase